MPEHDGAAEIGKERASHYRWKNRDNRAGVKLARRLECTKKTAKVSLTGASKLSQMMQ
jgi:hypothetical protein